MIRCGLLLAAGASRRFGPQDKLLADLHGSPLIAYAAAAMRGADLDHRIAVITNPALIPHLDGFQIVRIDPGPQSHSLRAGLHAAGTPARLLIALGDMPRITVTHLTRILQATKDDRAAASIDASTPMPPACFPRNLLPALAHLTGDHGAGRLVRDLPDTALIPAPGLLCDIDTIADLHTQEKRP